jgi:hypothetical protein
MTRAEARARNAKRHAARREGDFVRGRCGKKDFVVRSSTLHVECPECRTVMAVTEELRRSEPKGGKKSSKKASEPKPDAKPGGDGPDSK